MDNYDKDTIRVGICAALILIALGICGWSFQRDLRAHREKLEKTPPTIAEKEAEVEKERGDCYNGSETLKNCNCCHD